MAGGGGLFERFTEGAREATMRAQNEARALGHNRIAPEHLLLGVLAAPEVAKVTAALGIDYHGARGLVSKLRSQGSAAPEGTIPFAPEVNGYFAIAAGQALVKGHEHVGVDHFLTALSSLRGEAPEKLLGKLGANADAVTEAVEAGRKRSDFASRPAG